MSESATQPVRDLRRGSVTWSAKRYSPRWRRWAGCFCLLLSLFGLWTPTSALAQSCTTTVSDTADSGANTLRGKIAAAVAGSVICLPSATITLATPVLLDKSLTISGTGASGSIVSGGNATRVLSVTAGVNVVLQGLTVRDGFLENGDFFGNEPGHGAGIYNAGTLTVRSSQVISNGLINTLSSSN